jgi:hypothetical protein
MDKWEDCNKCICVECMSEFGTNAEECEFSDCEWCQMELGEYSHTCYEYIEKGGKYGRKPGGIE